jgi:CHASE2 domain-containing sensor protein
MPAEQVLFRSGTKANGGQEQIIPDLKDKLVLVGGTYRGYDRHFTPVGTLPGVIVLANAIQTELSGKSVQAYPRWALFLIEFSAGLLLILIIEVWNVSSRASLLWAVPIVLALSLIFSLSIFHSFSRMTAFASTLLAVLFIEIIEHMRRGSILRVVHKD